MRATTPAHLNLMYLFALTVKDVTSSIIHTNTLTVYNPLPVLCETHRALGLDIREIVGRLRAGTRFSSVQ